MIDEAFGLQCAVREGSLVFHMFTRFRTVLVTRFFFTRGSKLFYNEIYNISLNKFNLD